MAQELFLIKMGQRISRRRNELKMTQAQLAEKMDVSVQMISNLESGKKAIRPENLAKLCYALAVSADYVLTGKELSYPYEELITKIMVLPQERLRLVSEIIDLCESK